MLGKSSKTKKQETKLVVEVKLLQTEFLQLKTTMTEDYCKKKTATGSDFTEDPECFKWHK